MSKDELLAFYRRVMDHIHFDSGNIFYDAGNMKAYCIIAKIASEERNGTTACAKLQPHS
jgi:hypothetical protein